MTAGYKTGGRKKGTPNKRTQAVIDKLEELGCDPIEGMVRIAEDENNPVEVRVQCYKELAQYTAPKMRTVQHTTEEQPPVTREQLVSRLRELVSRNPELLELIAVKGGVVVDGSQISTPLPPAALTVISN